VKVKLSFFVVSAAEVAVITGEKLADVGGVAGGVYVAVKVGGGGATKVPQPGEQLTPAAVVNIQETPKLLESLETVAFKMTGPPPTVCVVNLFEMLTIIPGKILKVKSSL
jgi:hypothetical protein